jgi:hypothetical protein
MMRREFMRTDTKYISRNNFIAVFCGARPGVHPGWVDFAAAFGVSLAERGFGLVYGGGGRGIMGAVADGVLSSGGGVVGIVPQHLHERERADRARGQIFVVRSMHQRKALMYRLSRAFVVLPGGIGTMDELMEVLTWNQLGIMDKPVVLVNHRRFFDPLIRLLDHLVAEGFLTDRERALVRVAEVVPAIVDFQAAVPHLSPAMG